MRIRGILFVILSIVFLACMNLGFGQEVTADPVERNDWYMGKIIADIQFSGLDHVPGTDLDPIVRRFKGRIFTEELWMDLQSQLYELDLFETISPIAIPADKMKESVIVKFTMKERPWIESIRIEGNSTVRVNEIMDVVKLKKDDVYVAAKAKLDVVAARDFFIEKGYPDISVTSSTQIGSSENSVILVFTITEGLRVSVKQINFSGNSAFSSTALKDQLSLKEEGFLQPGIFKELKLETDKLKLLDYMKSKGHIDARIVEVTRETLINPKDFHQELLLTFVIDEGEKYYFGGYSFRGNKIFSTEKLQSIAIHPVGISVDFGKIKADKASIDDLYFENGYIFNKIVINESRDNDKKIVSYSIEIEEYERSHIENLIIKGNDRTEDYVIFRELPLEVGDVFSKTKIMTGLRNLYNLQFFSAVSPEMVPGSSENLMDLIITVEEQSTADLQFGATLSGIGGSSSDFPLSGLIKWNDRNFLGKGQELKIELNVSPSEQSVVLGFTEKWLFGKRISLGGEFSFNHQLLNINQDSMAPIFFDESTLTIFPDPYTSWEEYEAAGFFVPDSYKMPIDLWDISLGVNSGYLMKTPVGDLGFGGGLTTGLELKTYDGDKYRPFDYESRVNHDVWMLKNRFYARTYLNNLDLWYDPSNGYYAGLKAIWVGVLDSEIKHYIRLEAKAEGFLELYDIPFTESWHLRGVLAAHSGLSIIMQQPGRPLSFGTEGLTIDGTFVGRAWLNLASQQGITLWENWVEFRTPIVESLLSFDMFFDAAALQTESGLINIAGLMDSNASSQAIDMDKTLSNVSLSNFAFSVGFGIRFTLPQFPFRLYFAKRFYVDGSNTIQPVTGQVGGLDFVIGLTMPLN